MTTVPDEPNLPESLALDEANRQQLRRNWQSVIDAVAAATRAAGRDPKSVCVVPATKYVDARVCANLVALGATALGENRVQDVAAKAEALALIASDFDVGWRFIGHLQRNKARKAIACCASIDTVDSAKLADAIDRIVAEQDRAPMPVLIEVKLSPEATKAGCDPADLPALVDHLLALPHVELHGLFTMPPFFDDDAERARPFFQQLRELANTTLPPDRRDLSMGMTGDFPIAIAEGATHVRIGSALFEGLSDDHRLQP